MYEQAQQGEQENEKNQIVQILLEMSAEWSGDNRTIRFLAK